MRRSGVRIPAAPPTSTARSLRDTGRSADMNHLTEDDLYDEVEAIISASDFIEKTEGAQLLFI